ncbi:putative PurR-regulated permease PerM [Leucobacter komagatae]|uniref:Putative PurR-regulated permease PerM n=1 Tax=Leucobacter komagatae TaxID=55969 RepID=A0A542Y946_9MICO|nr:AI-2E family transporter [Leucobacter komagatae]TQL44609.1 putative PurR-regulated permease PerM [Leucobacter komagatae]
MEEPNKTPDRVSPVKRAEEELPLGMRVAAAWSWRLIIIAIAVGALIWGIVQVRIIVIPLLIAILLTALLNPVVDWFIRRGLPRWSGVVGALGVLVAALWVLIWLIVTQLRDGFGDFSKRSVEVWNEILDWVQHNTLGIPVDQLDDLMTQAMQLLENNQGTLWTGALGVATTATQVATGALLTIFSLIFLLIDGKRIWYWVVGFTPARAHAAFDAAGRAGWVSVGQYVRVQIFVAFVDAVGIGLGAAILGVPFAIPVAILVFLGSFIPFLGAIVTGALAAFIALVYNGPVTALIMLGVVVLVNQIEGHVLQPLVMGNAVRVHPLGVVLAVTTGTLLAGIPGALFAVPIAAAANTIVGVFAKRQWETGLDPAADFHRRDQVHRVAKSRAKQVAKHARKGNIA